MPAPRHFHRWLSLVAALLVASANTPAQAREPSVSEPPATADEGTGDAVDRTAETVGASRGYAGPVSLPAPALAGASAGVGSPAVSETPMSVEPPAGPQLPPRHRWVYRALFAGRYNPLGLLGELSTGYRLALLRKPGALYKDSFLGAKAHLFVNPAFVRVGPRIEISPLTVLKLTATYNYVGWFTSFGQLQSFPTPTAPHSEDDLEAGEKNGDHYAAKGHLLTLEALLQAKVWNIAIRDNPRFYYAALDLRNGDTVYYDQTLDILEPNDGWVVANDLDLIYVFPNNGLKLGARYSLTHAFYQRKHFEPLQPISRPNGPTHRVGPAVVYTFYNDPTRRVNKPTLFALIQFWARHRYRTGAFRSPGIPYFVIGFTFTGDFFPNPCPGKKCGRRRKKKKNKT